MTPRIYLARHATPDWTRKDIPYHLPPGPPLTEQGLVEAQALGAFLHQAEIQYIYASPLERCQKTAQIVGEICQAPVETVQGLIELQPGEETDTVRARVVPVFDKAGLYSQEAGPVALITHGGPVDVLLSTLGIEVGPLRIFDHRNVVPPAGAWLATRQEQDRPWELSLVFKPDLAAVSKEI